RNDNEKDLWFIWKDHTANPDDHKKIITACKDFKKKNEKDPLVVVTEGLCAWHMFKAGMTNEAVNIYNKLEPSRTTTLRKAGSNMAKSWLTRFDRELMKISLKHFYRKNIFYPDSIDAIKSLPEAIRAPLTDRWGKPWDYTLVGYKSMPNFPLNQKYEIKSIMLGQNSNLRKYLQKPYAERLLRYQPVKMFSKSPGNETIEFKKVAPESADPKKPTPKSEQLFMSITKESGIASLAYVGKKLIVITDRNFWNILPKPK
ncbi:hypothetical protein ACFLS1_12895, partial [Verrucomicrobiota bacterium]